MDEQTRGAIGCGWAILGVAFLVAASFTGGTFRTEVTYQPPKFGAVSGEVPFEETFTVRHWLGGLIRGETVDLDRKLERWIRDGEQVTHLVVETRLSVPNLLAKGFTLGIYTPETVLVRGRVSRDDAVATR
jgi:hypothetical protein